MNNLIAKRFSFAVLITILIHIIFLLSFLKLEPKVQLVEAPYILLGNVELPPKVIPKKPKPKKSPPPKVIKKQEVPKPPPPAKAPVKISEVEPKVADLVSSQDVIKKIPEIVENIKELDNTEFEPIYNPRPRYPKIAQLAEIEGFVVVELLIGKKGRVKKYSIIKTEGHQQFALETAKVLRKWRFPPPRINGEPTTVRYEYTITFTLDD